MISLIAVLGTMTGAYLLGSISFGIIVTKWLAHTDIRDMGSGNTGMTNVLRSVGTASGALTGVGDFAKGAISIILGHSLFSWAGLTVYTGVCLAGLCVLAGHIFPLYYGFRGGKGVMTSAGILLILNPFVLAAEAIIFATTFSISRIISLSSLTAASFLPVANIVYCLISKNEIVFSTGFMVLMAALVFFTHRTNIQRLRAGTEGRLSIHRA